MKFAVLAPVLFVIVSAGVDYGRYYEEKDRLQEAADAASLAAAKGLGMADARTENVKSVVEAVVEAYMGANHDAATYSSASKAAASAASSGGSSYTVETSVSTDPLEVHVTTIKRVQPVFGFVAVPSEVTVQSVARIVGRPNICVLGLDSDENGTISLEQKARVTGNECAVFSNSSHTNAIKAKNSASMEASLICSRGGKDGGPGNFTPEPLTDCPSFDDPLLARPEPPVDACLETDLKLDGVNRTLVPGTYCGGVEISDGSYVELDPGIYVFKDGPLVVKKGATLVGRNAGLFFIGVGSELDFDPTSKIDLTAPINGLMAGLLIFESRSQPESGVFKIMSDDARTLLGTIYIPKGELRVDANSPVADQSAYTAIIARIMRLYGGPHLVLNTNYDLTPVPVPEGIRGSGQPAALVR